MAEAFSNEPPIDFCGGITASALVKRWKQFAIHSRANPLSEARHGSTRSTRPIRQSRRRVCVVEGRTSPGSDRRGRAFFPDGAARSPKSAPKFSSKRRTSCAKALGARCLGSLRSRQALARGGRRRGRGDRLSAITTRARCSGWRRRGKLNDFPAKATFISTSRAAWPRSSRRGISRWRSSPA